MAGKEPGFGLDNFDGPKYYNETETIANGLLNLLFGKPGFFPSMPDLGINIQQYLYLFEDEFDVDVLKAKIISQCSYFSQFVDDGTLQVTLTPYLNKPMLLLVLPLVIKNTKEHLAIGITRDDTGKVKYNYVFAQDVD